MAPTTSNHGRGWAISFNSSYRFINIPSGPQSLVKKTSPSSFTARVHSKMFLKIYARKLGHRGSMIGLTMSQSWKTHSVLRAKIDGQDTFDGGLKLKFVGDRSPRSWHHRIMYRPGGIPPWYRPICRLAFLHYSDLIVFLVAFTRLLNMSLVFRLLGSVSAEIRACLLGMIMFPLKTPSSCSTSRWPLTSSPVWQLPWCSFTVHLDSPHWLRGQFNAQLQPPEHVLYLAHTTVVFVFGVQWYFTHSVVAGCPPGDKRTRTIWTGCPRKIQGVHAGPGVERFRRATWTRSQTCMIWSQWDILSHRYELT
jgi:hypothetical protein